MAKNNLKLNQNRRIFWDKMVVILRVKKGNEILKPTKDYNLFSIKRQVYFCDILEKAQ
jgi:hypothetical protein